MPPRTRKSHMRLSIPPDKYMRETRFFHFFMDLLPASLKETTTESGKSSEGVVLRDPNAVPTILNALKGALGREMRWMKTSYRKCLVKRGVDQTKKEYLNIRIAELETSAPDSDEIIFLQNELIAMDQYEMRFDELRILVDDFSEYLTELKTLEESEMLEKDPGTVAKEIEGLLSDVLPTALDAENMARGLV